MIKSFFKTSIFYIFSTFLTKGIGLLLLPVYTRYLSVSEYGALDFLLVIGTFIAVVVPLEVSQGLHRFLPERIEQPQILTDYYSTGFWFTVLMYTFFAVMCTVFSVPLADLILNSSKDYLLITTASWVYASNALVYLATSLLRSKLEPVKSMILAVLTTVTTALFSIYALVYLNLGLLAVLVAMLLGSLFSVLLSIYFTRHNIAMLIDRTKLKILLKFSLPLVPSSISVIATMYVDRLVIKDLLSLEELGQYGFASRIAMITSLVMVGFQQALSPLIYSSYKQENTRFDIAKLFWIFVVTSVLATLAIYFNRFHLIEFLGNENYIDAAPLITPLCVTVLLSSCYLFFPGLPIAQKSSLIALLTISGASINLVLNYILIKEIGLIGAAYSSMASAAITAILYIVISNKYYTVPVFKIRRSE